MKKILVILAFAGLVFSCSKTEDDSRADSEKVGKSDGLGLYASDGTGGSDGSGSSTGSGGQGEDTIQSGQITAGEWNDLANWDFWNNLGQDQDYVKMPEYWSYNLNNRISVKLQNNTSENLPDVKIELLNASDEVIWTCKTDNFGTAELFPQLKQSEPVPVESLKIRINNTVFTDIHTFSQGVNNLTLNLNPLNSKKCDIAFVVDATGSMGDELEFLKVELIDVIGRVKTANPDASLNLGSIYYRDTDDEFLTRVSDFSSDVNKTIDFIRKQSANGGGDFPEAVHTALDKAINNLQWSNNATSRIIFLVLDAPPHYEPQIVTEIHNLIATAASKGIKVIPVVASGIDKETEFLMRYMSVATNGTYVFITGDSGIGGEHLVPTVGEYEVEHLNALIERLINKYLE
jgi:hypothetical protein